MRTQWVSPTAQSERHKLLFYLCMGWRIVFHHSCRRHIRVPVKAGREGSPRGATPMLTHPTLHNSQTSPSSPSVTPQPAPSPCYCTDTLSTCSIGVLHQWDVPKSRGSASPLLGSTGGKLSWKERSAASTLHFYQRYKHQPTRSACFSSENNHLFNFSKEECCQMLGKCYRR